MLRSTLNKAVTGILLACFAFFIAAPVSAFAPVSHLVIKDNVSSGIQEDGRLQVARFSYAVQRRQLNTVRHLELLRLAGNERINGRGFTGKEDYQAYNAAKTAALRLMVLSRASIPSHRSRSTAIRFFFSGISPPFSLS
jgi:hypothetical protein